ncbi:protein pinocchio-like [Macrosteles quadrilineatus]|uniref:protein pinocchio-like n=1 Tax=Macrosteles quadrilineatus TaxID=74068 RepID=UPI0023E2E4CB|nr:protein pinocchio-like [Macrosteles quadrilineatus]XP_054268806.1 protein pinocchio-like [Macrosteles quadrilineatus]
MSVASVHPNSQYNHGFQQTDFYTETSVLSIEEIRLQMYSCFTCGVSWLEDHVCLDCAECGGYSLQRPCPQCDGQCNSLWKRDITLSHASGKARWTGECLKKTSESGTTQEKDSSICKNLSKLNLKS